MGWLSSKDFEGFNNSKSTPLDWLAEIARVASEKDMLEELIMKQKSKIKSNWGAAVERVFEMSSSKREGLMREKALKKPMEIDPKKQRCECDGPKLMHSAIDALRRTNSSKRNCQSRYDDDDNDIDWEPVEHKMQKMMLNNNVKKVTASIKNTPKKQEPIVLHNYSTPQYHDLPEEFSTRIDGLGGTDVALVIQKKLTKTDLTPSGNRMSMPLNQITSTDFLKDIERNRLENEETMTVQLIDPGLIQTDINLRRWNMEKGEGSKSSKVYVLRTQWGEIARRNRLRQDDLVQVWSFRVKEELYLALVLVKRNGGVSVDQKESDDGWCESGVVDADDQSSGGSQGGRYHITDAERRDGNYSGNSSGGSTMTNGSDQASPSHSGRISSWTWNGSSRTRR